MSAFKPDHTGATGEGPDVIVFDVGRVLIEWDPRHLYRKLIPGKALREWFLEAVCSPEWNESLDRGRDWGEAVESLIAQFPDYAELIRAYDTRWMEMVPDGIWESARIKQELQAKGHAVYALSNFAADKFVEIQLRFPYLRDFDGLTVSAHTGTIKPEPAIYESFLEHHGLKAGQCLFIDDKPVNIRAAQELGFHGHVFTDPRRLRQDLERYKFL